MSIDLGWFRWMAVAVALACCLQAGRAEAQCVTTPYIVVDAQSCDWTAAEKPLVFANNNNNPPGSLDLLQTQLTDNYNVASTGNGSLYGLMTFAAGTNFQVNAQVGLFINIPGGPAPDAACGANYALSYTCIANPCTTVANWDAHLYGTLSGNACQTAQTGTVLTLAGANQQAAFAITGTTIEFGATFAALGLPTTFSASPYSTTDAATNANMDSRAVVAYSASTVGPTAVTVSRLAARADGAGVTVGWITQTERGNLGFWLWRSRDGSPWVRANSEMIRGQLSSFAPTSYRQVDPEGQAGDRYLLSDLDGRTGRVHHTGPVTAEASTDLPERRIHARRAGHLPREVRAGNVARLGVAEEGMYRVGPADLEAAGVTLRGDAELSFWGNPVALERSGTDFIFYAGPVQNAYDGVDAYLLGARGHAEHRSSHKAKTGSLVSTVESHVYLKEDRAYNWYQGGDDPYIWAWSSDLFPVDPVGFDAPAAAPGAHGSLLLDLVGGTAFGHHVGVELNGVALGEVSWTGNGSQPFFVNLPAGSLQPSGNTLAIVSIFDTGAPYEFVMLRSIDLVYDRLPLAVKGEARFSLEPGRCATVSGLGAGQDAWDVTDPSSAAPGAGRISGDGVTVCSPNDGYAHTFEVFDASALRQPTVRPASANLRKEPSNVADELLIVHPTLLSAVAPLVRARAAQGLRVQVVSLTDVYDTFGFGNEGREPIRAFLRYAHSQWRRAPRYVLLVGGANADVRDVMATGVVNLIPSGVVVAGPEGMRAASDSWFVAGDDGLTPEAAIGRLAVDSAEEATAVIGKILAGDHQGRSTGRAVLVADVVSRFDDADFGLESAAVADRLGAAHVVPTSLSAGESEPGLRMAASLGQGVDLWHYVGHAGTSMWGSEEWFQASDVAALRNTRWPILTSFDCLDGMFDNPTTTSMGWAAVENVGGGALASFVPSTVLSPREGHWFDLLVTDGLATRGAVRIGDGLLRAQRQAAAQLGLRDFVRTYNLLGDPASISPLD
jgi:hypothetical protein